MLHLPCKTNRRCSKCCTCYAKRGGAQSNQFSPGFRGPLYEGAPSAAPASHHEPEMLQVLRQQRKTKLRCSKCCACHAKRGGAQSNQLSCTCHAQRAGGAPSPAPATQKQPACIVVTCRRTSADLYMKVLRMLHLPRKTSPSCSKRCTCHAQRAAGAPSAAPATQKEPGFRGAL